MEGQFISYLRVSTTTQSNSGLGIAAQRASVSDYLNGRKWTLLAEYVEVESGKRSNRPQLAAALAHAKREKAQLLIAKLDRLARNVHFISGLMESGVDFVAVDMPQANKLTIHIIAAMAEYERDMISQRTKAALTQAKACGVKLGNPTNAPQAAQKGREAIQKRVAQHQANTLPIIRELKASGITSLAEIARILNVRGVPSPRGCQWYPSGVRRVLMSTKTNG